MFFFLSTGFHNFGRGCHPTSSNTHKCYVMDQQEREEDVVSDMGCHFTWPELKRLDRMDLHRERLVIEQEKLDFKTLPTRTLAITNLLGFIDYSLNEQDKGIQRFKDVLALDPCNLIALSCLAIIYRRHCLMTLYQEHAGKLQRVLCANNPATLARAFADRALATKQFQQDDRRFTYMPYLVKSTSKGNRAADNEEKAEWQYEYALCLARKDAQHVLCKAVPAQVEPVLRDAAQSFCNVTKLAGTDHPYVAKAWANLGDLLLRQSNRKFKEILPHEDALHSMTALDCFEKALKVSRKDRKDPDVLVIIGAAYWNMRRCKEALKVLQTSLKLRATQKAHRQCGLVYMHMWKLKSERQQGLETSSGCVDALLPDASKRAPIDHVSGNQDALETTKNFDDDNGATKVPGDLKVQMENVRLERQTLSQSERGDKSPKINETVLPSETTDRYADNAEVKFESTTDLSGEMSLLLKAKESFTKAIHQKATHADHSDLGHVLFLLRDLHQSIQHYSIAVKCQEGDSFDTSLTHGRWAKCLEMLKEPQGARIQRDLQRQIKASMRDRTPSVDESWRYTHGVNCQGFECDISRFNYCADERPGFINILSEFNKTPVDTNIGFFPTYSGEFKYDFFVSFAHIDYRWAVSFVYKIEKDFSGLRGILRYRDYELGAAIADNIVNSVESSYRILIILTPDSLRDRWCRYEVQRAHMMNLTRPCVIPIMLRACKIPREIEHLSVVKCDQGQINTDDWNRLGRSLRQSEHPDIDS